MAVVRENLFWAFAYNVVLIPVAMGVLVPLRDHPQPGARRGGDGAVVGRGRHELAPAPVVRRPARRGPAGSGSRSGGRLRRGWYLVAVAIASLALAGGVIAADRAIDAGAVPSRSRASNVRFTPADSPCPAGRFVVLRFTNDDPVFHDWMVEGLANVDAGARPGQTQRLRFRLDTPGTYRIVCSRRGPCRGRHGRQPGRDAVTDRAPRRGSRTASHRRPADPRDLAGDFGHRHESTSASPTRTRWATSTTRCT